MSKTDPKMTKEALQDCKTNPPYSIRGSYLNKLNSTIL